MKALHNGAQAILLALRKIKIVSKFAFKNVYNYNYKALKFFKAVSKNSSKIDSGIAWFLSNLINRFE